MQPIDNLGVLAAQQIELIFTDIDDTLTSAGKLAANAYEALWRLFEAGIGVVPVTGRPAGWCDCIARQWPVAGIIGENGAFAYWENEGRLHRLYHPMASQERAHKLLGVVRDAVLQEVPFSRESQDQFSRQFDLAIDYCEELPDLGLAGAEAIKAVFERYGAQAKVSSIHVNGWFGDYDKLSMCLLFADKRWGYSPSYLKKRSVFCGDSPNDEPMFKFFPLSCAVSNFSHFADSCTHRPTFITTGPGGIGFTEMVDLILDRRV